MSSNSKIPDELCQKKNVQSITINTTTITKPNRISLGPCPSLGTHKVVDSGGALVVSDDVLLEFVELGPRSSTFVHQTLIVCRKVVVLVVGSLASVEVNLGVGDVCAQSDTRLECVSSPLRFEFDLGTVGTRNSWHLTKDKKHS